MGDLGASQLAAVLPSMTNLMSLDLGGNPLGGEGVQALADYMTQVRGAASVQAYRWKGVCGAVGRVCVARVERCVWLDGHGAVPWRRAPTPHTQAHMQSPHHVHNTHMPL